MAAAEERIALRTKKFEADVAAAKSNMVKEATRMVHTDMGDFFYQAGDLQVNIHSALHCQGLETAVCIDLGMAHHMSQVGCSVAVWRVHTMCGPLSACTQTDASFVAAT